MSDTTTAGTAGTIQIGDRRVNRVGFGAMRITGEGVWGPPEDRDEALAVLRRARELDVQLFDTADSYGPDVSEELIAEALSPYPDDVLVATKGGLTRGGPGEWTPNCRPEHLREACEASLRRLGIERIDLYQLHTVDSDVPYEESVGALADLQSEGKIDMIGVSNVDADHLTQARELVEVVSVQNSFSLGSRRNEDVLDACEADGIAFLPYFPLGGGRPAEIAGEIGEARGASAQQVSLAWLLARSPVTVPIPGTSSVEHLEDNVAAAALELGDDDLGRLDAAS